MGTVAGRQMPATVKPPVLAVVEPPEIVDAGSFDEELELLRAAKGGDLRAIELLLRQHRNLARIKSVSFYLPGASREDILQEAMIGLYKAVRDYDLSSGVPFTAFARLCIVRHLRSAVKGANRVKHQVLNSASSLQRAGWEPKDSGPSTFDDLRDPTAHDPGDDLIAAERLEVVKQLLSHELTELETRVVAYLVEGYSYEEIAGLIGSHLKAVDNALQRTRRKLRHHLEGLDAEPPEGKPVPLRPS